MITVETKRFDEHVFFVIVNDPEGSRLSTKFAYELEAEQAHWLIDETLLATGYVKATPSERSHLVNVGGSCSRAYRLSAFKES